MMTSESGPQRRVVVVGGGITGLAAAHRLLELARERSLSLDVRLFEASDRIGGNIQTRRRDGFLIEGGPDSFITQKPAGLALCRRLGIADQLIGTNPNSRRTYVVRDGVMHPVPEGFLLLAPTKIWPFITSRLFSWPAKLRMAMDYILPARRHGADGDESLADFVRRRFGREALDRVAQPMVSGIYTADPENLSLRATMPRFLEMEEKYGSIIKAMRAGRKAQAASGASGTDSGARYSLFVSFRDGMSTLTDTLAERIGRERLATGARVTRLERVVDGWRVHITGREPLEADAVILACPAYASAEIVRELDAPLADELSGIAYASSATMSLAYRAEQVGRTIDGFGFVVPAIEARTLIAVTVSSTKFAGRAPDGWVLLRAFLGGAMHPHVYAMSDDELLAAVRRDLHELMGVTGEPKFAELSRWPGSMPQYPVGHLDRVRRIHERLAAHAGLAVAGNAFGGVGIPDCVQSAESAAGAVVEALKPA